jgi:hypothetical protein
VCDAETSKVVDGSAAAERARGVGGEAAVHRHQVDRRPGQPAPAVLQDERAHREGVAHSRRWTEPEDVGIATEYVGSFRRRLMLP